MDMSAQPLASSMQVSLHRAHRDVENLANGFVAPSFLIKHHEACPLSFAEESETLFDDCPELRLNHGVQRVLGRPRQALMPDTLRIVE